MSEFQKAGTFDNPIEIVDDIINVDDLSDDDISDDFIIIYDSGDEENHFNCVSSDNIPNNPHSDQEFVDDDDDVLSLVLSSSDDECVECNLEHVFPDSTTMEKDILELNHTKQ
ncbi:Hypothetical predicted protein [Mytilus galloprovincialis]|uniref:Uncharacterized protein n=1 Tax=Mytilus galloprovincialis TaxID=29158 RepID=A0A8B6DFI2_MYTGA|nr:Hypothetical predicted protein [Mytilus galloprovincialis]